MGRIVNRRENGRVPLGQTDARLPACIRRMDRCRRAPAACAMTRSRRRSSAKLEVIARKNKKNKKRTTIALPLMMTTAADLLQRHFQTLVEDNAQWQTPIADDVVWELPYAPAIGHPAQLSGREEVVGHVIWFVGAVENFRFYDLKVHAFTDPQAAVAEVKAEGLIKPTGRMYLRDTCCSCERQATRSRSYANISILCVQLKRWTHRFLVLNHDVRPRVRSKVLHGIKSDSDPVSQPPPREIRRNRSTERRTKSSPSSRASMLKLPRRTNSRSESDARYHPWPEAR